MRRQAEEPEHPDGERHEEREEDREDGEAAERGDGTVHRQEPPMMLSSITGNATPETIPTGARHASGPRWQRACRTPPLGGAASILRGCSSVDPSRHRLVVEVATGQLDEGVLQVAVSSSTSFAVTPAWPG